MPTNNPKTGHQKEDVKYKLPTDIESRFDDAYSNMKFTKQVYADYTHSIDMDKIKSHLATEQVKLLEWVYGQCTDEEMEQKILAKIEEYKA